MKKLLLLLSFYSLCMSAFSQGTDASIELLVTDPTKAPVQGATVAL